MNRRTMLRLSVSGAGALVVPIFSNAQSPSNPIRPAALQRTGRPALSTFEAVKQVSENKVRDILPEVAEYYQHYGANYAAAGVWTPERAERYTRFIQRTLRQTETGKLTLEQAAVILTRKRCGRPDPSPEQATLAASAWRYTTPSWHVLPTMATNLTGEQWHAILNQAWNQWAGVSLLQPFYSSTAPSASCLHTSGSGRGDGFDGPGGVLAWAELPPTGSFQGQLLNRYDAGETWTAGTDARSIRALNVATHEIGHLLGLEHSSDPSALMAPFYDPDVSGPMADDIRRIRALYPKANPSPGAPGQPQPPAPQPPAPQPPAPQPPGNPNPDDGPCGRRPRWFPSLPRLFPRRRGTC